MKHPHYIYISVVLAAMVLLTACSSDDLVPPPTYTVGEADNAITLSAGISEGGNGVMTRAGEDLHVPFTAQTQLRLRVDGTWTGHAPETVCQMTTAKTAETASETIDGDANDKHAVEFTDVETLYWDDYGTADPANASTGRASGLTIYGVAVEGKAPLPTSTPTNLTSPTLNWTALPWNVGAVSDGKLSQTSGWDSYDLVYSNNVKDANTYKFSERASGKLLEFTHAMTKVTINLTAGEGFPGYTVAPLNAKFVGAPVVTLMGFNYTGTVNVETKTPSAPTATNIVAYRDNGLAWTSGGQHTSGFTALVFPGNTFADNVDIIKIEVDGNTYYVNATKINDANTELSNTFKQGKNYVLNITINKTDIEVTATIKNWIDVEADEEAPKINVTATYGYTAGTLSSTAFTNDYDLFRSTNKLTNYDDDNTADGINPAARFTSSAWNKTIYWPDHQTHYFFRGVYPQVGTAVSGTSAVAAEAVTTVGGNDVVAVANATYTAATYPSDLAIAFPRGTTEGSYDETCKAGHTSTQGICATEGTINMNFEYAMSKVEVRLKSTATGAGHIAMTKDNTKVEIIGGYSKARIKLSDGLHDAYSDADKGTYALSNLSSPADGYLVTSLDAIVPQQIGDEVKFRITVTTDDNSTPADPSDDKNDVYECKVNLIKETSTSTNIGEWKPGRHYIYVLDVNKTAISTTATLTDWVTVNASDNVWF